MSLLERIAYSNGNSQRTIVALRLVNDHLKKQIAQQSVVQSADTDVASRENKTNKRQVTGQLPLVLVF